MISSPRLKAPFISTLIALIGLLVLSGCEIVDQTVTPIFMMSPQQEIKFGQRVEAEMAKTSTYVQDPQVVDYVRRVGQTVIGNSLQKSVVHTQLYVVKNDEINAFAIPGGDMFVHTGLINAAQDEAELAAVIAHEYGHVVYRHAAKHVSRQMGINAIEEIIFSSAQSAQAARSLGSIVSKGVTTRYSREDELQADSSAIPNLYRAGYDPNALITIFQTLQTRYGTQSGTQTFFSSHPATAERIDRARLIIAKLPPKQTVRPITELRAVQARLIDLGMARR